MPQSFVPQLFMFARSVFAYSGRCVSFFEIPSLHDVMQNQNVSVFLVLVTLIKRKSKSGVSDSSDRVAGQD